MMIRLKKALRRLNRDEDGVTLVEYGIALTLAVAVGTFLLTNLGDAIQGEMSLACSTMATGANGAAPTTGSFTC